jgi:urease accessory protein
MRRALSAAPAGSWPEKEAVTSATLTFDDRHRRRVKLMADNGTAFLLDLEETTILRDGDGLKLDDGTWLRVAAAGEEVCDISCRNAQELARLAWHLGNRHLPVQIIPGGLRIRDDHVIVEMVRAMGAQVRQYLAPFTPEGGAYARGGGHDHDHHHHDHDHAHRH